MSLFIRPFVRSFRGLVRKSHPARFPGFYASQMTFVTYTRFPGFCASRMVRTFATNQQKTDNWNPIEYLTTRGIELSVEEKKTLDDLTEYEKEINNIKKVEKELNIESEGMMILSILSEISTWLGTMKEKVKNTTPGDKWLLDLLDGMDSEIDTWGKLISFMISFRKSLSEPDLKSQRITDSLKTDPGFIKLSELKSKHKRAEIMHEFNEFLLKEIKSHDQENLDTH